MNRQSRRDLLRASLAAGAGIALPKWFIDETMAADVAPPRSANDKPHLLLVGCGGRGLSVSKEFRKFADVVAVCDVDENHLANASSEHPSAKQYSDFRKALEHPGLDLVQTATPDHWHTLVNVAALNAGKDVYAEKPLTLTIDEGKHLIHAVRSNRRILQVGSQQRSDPKFRLACEAVRNGRLGKMQSVLVVLPAGRGDGPFEVGKPPAGFDWNFYQGQAPERPYVFERTHKWFRYWLDYSGGTLTDWGAHHNDIALWALNELAPVEIEGRSLAEPIPGGFDAPSQYDVKFTYASGVTQTIKSNANYIWNGSRRPDLKPAERGDRSQPPTDAHGITFRGSDGWIFVSRGILEASDPKILAEEFPSTADRLYVSNDHSANFFDCCRTRKDPVAPVEAGHRSVSACHLAVLSVRLGRKLHWDPQAEQFKNDDDANKLLRRDMRKPWSLS